MNLFELTKERLALQTKLQEMNFDETTIQDTLEGESTELQAKIEDYGFVIRNMEVFGEMMKAEETRMAERRKAHEAKVARIKAWLLENMQACQITKIECPAFTISLRNNPPKVIVTDENAIPSGFFHIPAPLPPQLDKKALANALKKNADIQGAHLEQGVRLEIK
ncbi:gp157-like protein [Caudoviricetes sp.]|nr:gp157-like protein [Caudoviricetes sp.]